MSKFIFILAGGVAAAGVALAAPGAPDGALAILRDVQSGCGLPPGKNTTVASRDELLKVVRCARDGTTIYLKPNSYGEIDLRGRLGLRLTAASRNKLPVLTGMRILGSQDISIDHLIFQGDPSGLQYRLLVQNSSNVKVGFLNFPGATGTSDPPILSAVFLRSSNSIQFSDSEIAWNRHGISFLNVNDTVLSRNYLHNLQTDGIRGGGASRLLVEGNYITSFHPVHPDHPDGIQLWSTQQTESAHDIKILDNLITRGSGLMTQGIFVRDTFEHLPFKNMEIRGNTVVGTMWNGIAVRGIEGGLIENNQVLAMPDQKSWIRITLAKDTTVRGNVAQEVNVDPTVHSVENKLRLLSDTQRASAIRVALAHLGRG